jgi:DNA-binding CsgD family transcriptional regulator
MIYNFRNSNIPFLLILLFFLSVSNHTLASNNFELTFCKSSNNKENISDVLDMSFSEMPSSSSFGVVNGTYWFKLKIDAKYYQQNSNAIIYVPTHNIDFIELYALNNGELEYISKTGNLIKEEDLALNYKFPSFKINNEDLENTFFLKVHFPKGANFPLKIISEKKFEVKKQKATTYLSFFYGISLVVLLIHLFFFLKFKNPYYLYYFGFLITLMFNLLLFDGNLVHFFRPFYGIGEVELIFHIIEEIFLLTFSIHFLGLKEKMPKFVKNAYYLPLLLAVAYVFYIIIGNFTIVAIADALGISTMLILWLIGIYYWKENPFAKLYVLGYFIMMPLGLYYFIGYGFGWWSVTGEDSIVKIGSTIDMLVFTYAITYRMNMKNLEAKNEILKLKKQVEIAKAQIENQKTYFIFLKEHKLINAPLTLKEIEILESICNNLTNNQIAAHNFISISTVKTHISNIFQKFSIKNRKELKRLVLLELNK